MRSTQIWLVEYFLNSLWQVPLVFAAAWVAARLARPAGPQAEHRIWVGALFLETFLPICSLDLRYLWRPIWSSVVGLWLGHSAAGSVHIFLSPGSASETGSIQMPLWLSTGSLFVGGLSLLYFTARLTWGIWRTDQIRRKAQRIAPQTGLVERFARLGLLLGFPAGRIARSSTVSSPVTVGIRHPTLLLPSSFPPELREGDMDTIVAHELAHMLRYDFAKNLFYQIISLPISWHPILCFTGHASPKREK